MKVSVEIFAQPSFLRLFFRDSLVPMTVCCQTMTLVGFFLWFSPLCRLHTPRRSKDRGPLGEGFHTFSCHTLVLSLHFDALSRLACRLVASCCQLWGSHPFLLGSQLGGCCQPPLRSPQIPGLRGLTPSEVFPSSAADVRRRTSWPSCRCLLAPHAPLRKAVPLVQGASTSRRCSTDESVLRCSIAANSPIDTPMGLFPLQGLPDSSRDSPASSDGVSSRSELRPSKLCRRTLAAPVASAQGLCSLCYPLVTHFLLRQWRGSLRPSGLLRGSR